MSQPKPKPIEGKLDPEVRMFYSVLGQFNTNMVAWYLKDPEKVREVTDFMIALCPVHAAECNALGPTHMWDETSHVCIRKDGENAGGGGGS